MFKPKCDWCGDQIHGKMAHLQGGMYHVKCVAESILWGEISDLNGAVSELHCGGVDVALVKKSIRKLTETMKDLKNDNI